MVVKRPECLIARLQVGVQLSCAGHCMWGPESQSHMMHLPELICGRFSQALSTLQVSRSWPELLGIGVQLLEAQSGNYDKLDPQQVSCSHQMMRLSLSLAFCSMRNLAGAAQMPVSGRRVEQGLSARGSQSAVCTSSSSYN